jgi:TetR/AcrR family tetracycline transcriptional repressor
VSRPQAQRTAATRDWHRGLTRDVVIAEALRIVDADGRNALTMRRLATALEVEAPSLYAHVRSKDDLIDAVLDSVLDRVPLPPDGPDARTTLAAGFRGYRATLLGHPNIVLLMTERGRSSLAQFRLAGRSIELLESEGLSNRQAVDVHVTAIAYTLGFVFQEVSRPASLPPGLIPDPTMVRTLKTLAERSVDDRFDVGLGLIFDGAGLPRATRGPG